MAIVVDLPEYNDPDTLRQVIADLDRQIKAQERELGRLRRTRGYYLLQLQRLSPAPTPPPQPTASWLVAFARRWQRRQR